ncbi:unnamed protein product [Brugia timori]|uniref:G_PROTEIN_RECEP_F1_2 domain-containing protein n=1 Tax=Brugia timori TaxID=42155 RepID=A0A0R3QL39_9BILA|nr:unnamed protein product [Brugia timori]
MYNQLINRFLLTLAINDLMMLLATFFIFSLPVITERMENISLINISSSLLVFFYPIAHTSHTCAVYTTILVSGYRYLGICHPFLVYRNNNNSRSIHIAITSAVVFSVVFNLPRCFEFQCVPCRSEIFHRQKEQSSDNSACAIGNSISDQSQSVPPKSIRSQSVSPKSVRYSISLLS